MHVTRIRAPFDGIVTERLRNIGERLNIADEVIRLVDPNSLEIIARAPLSTVNFIGQGDVLELHNDYRTDEAAVRTIVPFGNPQSHMFEVRLDADPTVWTVGESVRLSMPTASAEEGAAVFRVKPDLTVDKVNVITGLGAGTHIQVMGELEPGDTVVIRGAERLSPGAQVVYGDSSADAGGTAATH